ncbi:hypothetical protein RHODO2019_13615 [Rhodococcus antarcticus]|jgi:NAD(P)-dependent dehydrogenase (short-subunit alcohol dehydrogenase family)|uniref:Short subunit dehydrogenase n=1 Tax=Rhodococcus antarcticus TaxID=2987751 RepID=A0ABY6NXR1_9NOCA|nr:hypothetical protein [Rhodococcus antarcticus]UZJ24187.1 hypothetical protein RHODO2019_13615 [Rhodococcus antarcticus]
MTTSSQRCAHRWPPGAGPAPPPDGRRALVTGASRGIGLATTGDGAVRAALATVVAELCGADAVAVGGGSRGSIHS